MNEPKMVETLSDKEFVSAALKSKFYLKKLNGVRLGNWQGLPLTRKNELRQCDAYDVLGTSFENVATYHETSGTIGTPTPSWYSYSDTDQEAQVIIDSALGLNSKDLLMNRFPFALAVPSFILFWACQKVGAGHIALSKASMVTPHARVVEILKRTKPTIAAMLPSEAEIIAESARQQGVSLPTPNLRVLLLAGDLIGEERKKHLEKLWGVPVHCFFGSTETGGLFVTCKNGHYHLNHPKVKVEVVDKQFKPVPQGTKGYCVISSAREGMPLLRYFNEDIIEIRDGSNCGCGCTAPILIHYGREADHIVIGQKDLTFEDIQNAVYAQPVVPFLWRTHIYPDGLRFEYQLGQESSDAKTLKFLAKSLSERLAIPVEVQYQELMSRQTLVTKPKYSKFSYMIKHQDCLYDLFKRISG